MSFLDQWNALPAEEATHAVLPCCGSRAWARALAKRRPLSTLPELLAASDAAWWSLANSDWQEAFSSHPRIGEREATGAASAASLLWSTGEQSAAQAGDAAVKQALADGNRAYEAHFGRTFIVRAAERSAEDILDLLQHRLRNTAEAELHECAEQQREITHLRLRKWLLELEAKGEQ